MLIWFSSSVVISVMPTINTVEVAGWFEIQVDNWCWKIVKNFLEYVVIITEFLFLLSTILLLIKPLLEENVFTLSYEIVLFEFWGIYF